MADVQIQYSIEFGQNLRIEYKPAGSAGPYTQYPSFPDAGDSPVIITLPSGNYDLQLSTICPNCSGNRYSDPFTTTITVP